MFDVGCCVFFARFGAAVGLWFSGFIACVVWVCYCFVVLMLVVSGWFGG